MVGQGRGGRGAGSGGVWLKRKGWEKELGLSFKEC